MSDKTSLRLLYEREIGKFVCDRTWSRVKSRLEIDESLDTAQEDWLKLRCYAHLRKMHPNKHLSATLVSRFVCLREFLGGKHFSGKCSGKEIYAVIQSLRPRPSDATVYRWGKDIGIEFSKSRVYFDKEVIKWIEKIALNPRYEYTKQNLGVLTNGQNQRAA